MNNNKKGKKTLADDAAIYQNRGHKSEKDKISEMTRKERISYIFQYYGVKVLIAILAIAGLIYFIYSVTKPKIETVLSVALINTYIEEETKVNLEDDLSKHLNIGDMEEVYVDSSYSIDPDSYNTDDNISEPSTDIDQTSEIESEEIESEEIQPVDNTATVASQVRLSTYIAAGEIDIIITTEELFDNYVNSEFFDNLEDLLPTDVFGNLSDKLYFATIEEVGESKPYGIYLDDLPFFQDYPSDEPRILGIVVNSSYKNNCVSALRYLFDN